jgi:hypothetical protein
MNGKLWTGKEIEILRHDTENHVPRAETAVKLGRTAAAVNWKMSELGLLYPIETELERHDRLFRQRWKRKLPAMKAAIREAVLQSA